MFSINSDITQASTLPTSFYKDHGIYERCKEEVFASSWQFVGDEGILDAHSNYPFKLLPELLEEPLLLTKANGSIRCLSNVCTHRGNILVSSPDNSKQLVCRYHGRKFDREGKFLSMPQFDEAKDFPSECDHLTQVPLHQWEQFLFASLQPKFSFDSVIAAMEERIGFLPLEKFNFSQANSKTYEIKAHWALYCDNYLEGFHIPFVHHDLNDAVSYQEYETVVYDYCNVQIATAKDGTEAFSLPKGHIDYGRDIAAYYFWIFPNMMFNFYPWGLSINLVSPLAIDKTKVSFLGYVFDQSKIENSAGELLDKVEMEDEEVVESVQSGIKSRFYEKGRFSPQMEKGVHHFHCLIDEFLKKP